jgi:hypothetical protein
MFFEEVLNEVRLGKSIRRENWDIETDSINKIFSRDNFITFESILSDDWYVVDNQKKHDLTFSEALELIKKNERVSRKCWKNENIFVFLVESESRDEEENFLQVKTSRGLLVPWIPNHNELLADDWYVLS